MIKGLTPRLAEAGKIKIGGLGAVRQGKNGPWRMPEKHDSITITRNYRNTAAKGVKGDLAVDEFMMAALVPDGGKLTEVPVILHSDIIDEVFPTSYSWYTGRNKVCEGDGEVATRWEVKDGAKTGRTKEMPCPCPMLEERKCKPHGTLFCSINVPGQAVAGAIHTWRTTSIISINRMLASMQQVINLTGMLQNLPLWLVLSPVDTENGTVYVMHLELRAGDLMEAQKLAIAIAQQRHDNMHQIAGMKQAYKALIAAPVDDEAEIQQEFHPEPEKEKEKEGGRVADLRAKLLAKQEDD